MRWRLEAELLAAGDAAAADCWSLPGLCADMFASPAAAGLGGGGPGGPAAAARRAAGGMRFETCGTVGQTAQRRRTLALASPQCAQNLGNWG
eukprot:scaffold22238_cov62-Phaeocystis_antarctica.AAC.5